MQAAERTKMLKKKKDKRKTESKGRPSDLEEHSFPY